MLLRHLFKKNKRFSAILHAFSGKINQYEHKGIREIPRPAILLAIGGFEIKVYPRWLVAMLFKTHIALNIPLNFVIHSWDLIDTPGSRTSKICSAEEFKKRLFWFVKTVKSRSEFKTLGEKYENIRVN